MHSWRTPDVTKANIIVVGYVILILIPDFPSSIYLPSLLHFILTFFSSAVHEEFMATALEPRATEIVPFMQDVEPRIRIQTFAFVPRLSAIYHWKDIVVKKIATTIPILLRNLSYLCIV